MKRQLLAAAVAIYALFPTATGCKDLLSGQSGTICISIDCESAMPATRAGYSVPAVEEFILTVAASDGTVYYEGPYGQSPESMAVPAGSYTVSAVSESFEEPAYDSPQYGDSQVVVVNSGSSVNVSLYCTQQNTGIKLLADDSFKSTFPSGFFTLKGSEGSLKYSYGETRAAFFKPGTISIYLTDGGLDQLLFSRTLTAAQMLTMKISSSVSSVSGGVTIQVDTTRNWTSDSYCYGDNGGGGADEAYSVSEARDHLGQSDCWVWGYIVGVATNTSKFSFTSPFTKNTNLVLGLRETSSESEWLLSVELPSGSIRSALNLVDNPTLLGKKIALRGSLVSSYYGIPGLKSPTEYQFR